MRAGQKKTWNCRRYLKTQILILIQYKKRRVTTVISQANPKLHSLYPIRPLLSLQKPSCAVPTSYRLDLHGGKGI